MIREFAAQVNKLYVIEELDPILENHVKALDIAVTGKALFSAIPVPDPNYKMKRIVLQGSIPSPANPPSGCKFHTRCEKCMEICKHISPDWAEVEPGHFCAAAYTGPLRRLVSGQQKNTAAIHTCRAECLRCFFDYSLRIRTCKNRLSSKRTEYYEVLLPESRAFEKRFPKGPAAERIRSQTGLHRP